MTAAECLDCPTAEEPQVGCASCGRGYPHDATVLDDGTPAQIDTSWLLETLTEVRTQRPYDPRSGPGRAWDDAITILARRVHEYLDAGVPVPAEVAS